MLTKQQKHDLLMQHKNHYLWNIPYKKWTAEDEQNLLKGLNKSGFDKQPGNRVGMQPVKMVEENGLEKMYKSVADCSRKTGVSQATIFSSINGRRVLKKVKYPLFEKVTN